VFFSELQRQRLNGRGESSAYLARSTTEWAGGEGEGGGGGGGNSVREGGQIKAATEVLVTVPVAIHTHVNYKIDIMSRDTNAIKQVRK
jgi:hypothetical protein